MEAKRLTEEVRDASARQEQRLQALENRLAALETKTVATQKTAAQLWDEGNSALKAGALRGRAHRAPPAPGQVSRRRAGRRRPAGARRGLLQGEEVPGVARRVPAGLREVPDSPLADDSAFRAGEAAEELKWCTDARAYFGLLIQRWPKSNLVKKAKDKDAALKKAAKDKKKCQAEK